MDSPVDLYSGTAQVNIPVYTLKDGSVELPISLSYATSGIKVNEEAGWVGLGWMLDVGGCITRKVIGEIDCYNPEPYYKNVMAAYEQTGKLSNTTHIKGPWSSDMRLAMDWFLQSLLCVKPITRVDSILMYSVTHVPMERGVLL